MNTGVNIRTWECSYKNEECGNGVCEHGNGNWEMGISSYISSIAHTTCIQLYPGKAFPPDEVRHEVLCSKLSKLPNNI